MSLLPCKALGSLRQTRLRTGSLSLVCHVRLPRWVDGRQVTGEAG